MDKLIELFNEFMEKEKNFASERELITSIFEEDLGGDDGTVLWVFMQNPDKGYAQYSYPEWTSKKFGFIKWLVENDKIDRNKLEIRPFSDGLVYSDSDCTVYRNDTTYEMLLMLLSIQDEPIEYLCKILK